MNVVSRLLNNKRFENGIFEIISRQDIPNISRIILNEDASNEISIVILTKTHINLEFAETISNIIENELKSFMGIEIFLVLIKSNKNFNIMNVLPVPAYPYKPNTFLLGSIINCFNLHILSICDLDNCSFSVIG